uniref:hypothetical protein n=1 Tax=Faecalibaculum rodentium TaxID=1702221 RepID=UPI0025A5145E
DRNNSISVLLIKFGGLIRPHKSLDIPFFPFITRKRGCNQPTDRKTGLTVTTPIDLGKLHSTSGRFPTVG